MGLILGIFEHLLLWAASLGFSIVIKEFSLSFFFSLSIVLPSPSYSFHLISKHRIICICIFGLHLFFNSISLIFSAFPFPILVSSLFISSARLPYHIINLLCCGVIAFLHLVVITWLIPACLHCRWEIRSRNPVSFVLQSYVEYHLINADWFF